LEAERLVGDGVNEGEGGGVEGLAGSATGFGLRRLADFMRVDFFSAETVADFGQVDADLMCAARFKAAFEDGVVAEVIEGADVGNRAAGFL
jgi:hypothetical protein